MYSSSFWQLVPSENNSWPGRTSHVFCYQWTVPGQRELDLSWWLCSLCLVSLSFFTSDTMNRKFKIESCHLFWLTTLGMLDYTQIYNFHVVMHLFNNWSQISVRKSLQCTCPVLFSLSRPERCLPSEKVSALIFTNPMFLQNLLITYAQLVISCWAFLLACLPDTLRSPANFTVLLVSCLIVFNSIDNIFVY